MIPHDLDTERAVIGAVLYGSARMVDLAPVVTVADFHSPAHAAIWMAVEALHGKGEPVTDTVAVASELDRQGTPHRAELLAAQVAAPPSWRRHVDDLIRLSVARRVQHAATELAKLAETAKLSPADLMAEAAGAFTAVAPTRDPAADVEMVEDFLASADAEPAPWVVPGMLRRGWRALVVAPEGAGKSVCLRQIAMCAAQGIEPFTGQPAAVAARVLIVDLENPDDAIAETLGPISEQARRVTGYDAGDRAWIWRRPGGIDLRQRRDQGALAAVCGRVHPDLVVLGPLYKAYRVGKGDSDENAAGEVQGVLDDLRTRHDFALLMEHHAPKGSGLGPRDLVPYGSSLWLRWPEIGLSLVPTGEDGPPGSLLVGRWRRDRMRHAWPDRLDRGGLGRFPWVGYWRDGIDQLRAS